MRVKDALEALSKETTCDLLVFLDNCIRLLSPDERATLMEPFCRFCWKERPKRGCTCMRDE